MMRSLFGQIFLWLWVSITLAILAAGLLASLARHSLQKADRQSREILLQFAGSRLKSLARSGNCELPSDAGALLFVFENTHQCYGPPAPRDVMTMGKAAARTGRLVETTLDSRLVALTTRSGNHSWNVVAGAISPTEVGNESLVFRLFALVCVFTVACAWLARYITCPVEQIRDATVAFAAGNLGTRIKGSLPTRADVLGQLAMNFDIMADRIETLLTSQTRLLNDVSHELRSPLTRLAIASAIARRNEGSALTPALERIETEVEHLDRLIGQLLTLARLSEPGNQAQPVLLDMSLLLQGIAEAGQFEAHALGRDVICFCPDRCPFTGRPELLRRAIENVVRNAIRYTAVKTAVEIRLHTAKDADSVLVEVRDHGVGVPEAALEKIFEPFYRVSGSFDTLGTGLGLAIARRAIALHNGTITALNNPDGGLTIAILLPQQRISVEKTPGSGNT